MVVREVTGARLAERALRRSQEELERRVSRRTAELSAANAELEREIGERRRAERAAEEAQGRLRRFIEALPAVTYVAETGPAGRWRYVSPQIEALTGVRPEELLAEPGLWGRLIHPEDRERFHAEEEKSRGGGVLQVEYRILARDGRIVWLRDHGGRRGGGPRGRRRSRWSRASSSTSATARRSSSSCCRPRRWRRSAGSPAASPTTSTTC